MNDSIIDNVLTALRRVIRATDLHSRHLIKVSGLTTPQLLTLQALDTSSLIGVSELAKAMSLSQATVSSILDRLEQRELVTREKSAGDKRKTNLRLTDKARLILIDAPSLLQETFIKEFLALENWEQSQILSSLQRIAYMMDAKDLDAAPMLEVGALDKQNDIKP